MIPQPDNFDVTYNRWKLSGDKETGWFLFYDSSLLNPATVAKKHQQLGVHAPGATRQLEEVVEIYSLRSSGRASPKLTVALDWLLEQDWGWPVAAEQAFKFEWAPNHSQDLWTLFYREKGVFQVRVGDVYRRTPAEIREFVRRGLTKALVPADRSPAFVRQAGKAFGDLAYPGPLNEYAGPCVTCGGGGFMPDFGQEYVAVRCKRCKGTGEEPSPRGR